MPDEIDISALAAEILAKQQEEQDADPDAPNPLGPINPPPRREWWPESYVYQGLFDIPDDQIVWRFNQSTRQAKATAAAVAYRERFAAVFTPFGMQEVYRAEMGGVVASVSVFTGNRWVVREGFASTKDDAFIDAAKAWGAGANIEKIPVFDDCVNVPDASMALARWRAANPTEDAEPVQVAPMAQLPDPEEIARTRDHARALYYPGEDAPFEDRVAAGKRADYLYEKVKKAMGGDPSDEMTGAAFRNMLDATKQMQDTVSDDSGIQTAGEAESVVGETDADGPAPVVNE